MRIQNAQRVIDLLGAWNPSDLAWIKFACESVTVVEAEMAGPLRYCESSKLG